MTIYGSLLPGAASLARSAVLAECLTERAKQKLKVWDWYRAHGRNAALAARHFGIGRATLHRWLARYAVRGPVGLNEESRKPRRLRRPTTSWQVVMRTVQLRKQYPAWSKHKLRVLLLREGMTVSPSTVGRILKRRGLIDARVSRKRRKAALHPRARFPHGFKISRPGDMVQMDTKHLMLPGGRKLFQFTAIDVLSKQRVLRVYPSESSRNGAQFLLACLKGFPFPVRAVQTDNGAPFLKEFERCIQEKGIPHYFTYPRHPKQNSYVEISHGADEREFYQQGNVWSDRRVMTEKLRAWERVWNEVRPHEALGYLTPDAYLEKFLKGRFATKDTIILQT
jgi:transposase InsO family protein